MLILGIDPGLGTTGWGLIAAEGSRLSHVANGQIATNAKTPLPHRLVELDRALTDIILQHRPDGIAVEEVFINSNPQSTLKLGQARGVVMLAPAMLSIPVSEYAPNTIKKSVVGAGHAEKDQVKHMVKLLLPRAQLNSADSVDALAIAICHAHHRTGQTLARLLARS